MIKKIFHSQTNSFTFAAILISLSTLLSGALGLLRDRLLAITFGAGEALDIYFAAFRIPDFLQGIIVAGGITTAFLPIFSEECRKGKKKAFEFANNVLNCSLIFLLVVSFILFLLAPQILKFVAPGFSLEQIQKATVLTRIMFLSPVLFCLSSIFSGVLQYFDRFLVYSLAPILYNLGIIFGILFFVRPLKISGLAWGVVLGACLHVLVQIPAARKSGFYYSNIFNPRSPSFVKAARLAVPSAIGSGFNQVNLAVITALCSTLIPGSIAIFNFSKNLQYFPIGMIGVPFAISVFPALSRNWTLKNKEGFWTDFSLSLRQILFLTIPISFLVFLLRAQIVRIVLGAGLWGWEETRLTAGCLGIFSFSIFAFSLIPLFQKSFYSIQDTKTPTFLQILTVVISIVLSILFLLVFKASDVFVNFFVNFLKLKNIQNVRVIAFPLALSIAGFLHSFLLFFVLAKKTKVFKIKEIVSGLQRILIPALLMSGGVWFVLRPLALVFSLNTFFGVFLQTMCACLFGGLIYLFFAFVLGSPELDNLIHSILKR